MSLTEAELANLASQVPKKNVVPAPINSFDFDADWPAEPNGHLLRFTVLSQLPFPSLVFAATLNKVATDYQEKLTAIRDAWQDANLATGRMQLEVIVDDILLKLSVSTDNQAIVARRKAELAERRLTLLQIASFYDVLVRSNVITGHVEIGDPDYARSLWQEKTFGDFLKEHFHASSDAESFDEGSTIRLWDQVPVRVGDLATQWSGVKSVVVTDRVTI
ncbi:hypothetical protein [Mesorhizobium sp. M1396]|uniref:hypothetical protein n=1 Tax=Mesorhizobium sp. M1396 TaxID=2957095 RepID=UPI003338DEDD